MRADVHTTSDAYDRRANSVAISGRAQCLRSSSPIADTSERRDEQQREQGGAFDAHAAGIALVDDGGVHALGYGADNGVEASGIVSAIAVRGDDVFIGGQFARAGGWLSASVARFARVDDTIFASGFE